MALLFVGDEDVELVIGEGADHGIFDVYIDGTLYITVDGYASIAGSRTVPLAIRGDGFHSLEIRNRHEKNLASSGYKVRFQQLTVDSALTWDVIDYSYDSLSRLLQADYNNGATVYNYGYDVAGNMTNYDGVIRTYNAANQMTNDGTNSLTYDNNGNLRTVGSDTYTWDRANRLLSVDNHSYVYDGLGNRVQQTVSSVVTDYLNDLQPGLTKLLKQTTGANVEQFVHAPRGIHAVDDGTDWNFYAQDGLGSVRAVVDDAAVVQTSMSFDPYGNPVASYGASFGFTGEQTDENDNLYLRARYMNPNMGTFLSLDPFEGIPNRPMSLNGYSWVEGNIPNWIDATGMFSCTSENPRVSTACAELDVALERATMVFDFENEIVSNGLVDLKELVGRAKQYFGFQFQAAGTIVGRTALDLVDLDDCTQEIVGQLGGVENSILAKEDMIRAVAAMVHMSTKLSAYGNGANIIRGLIGYNSIQFFGQVINTDLPIGQGFVEPASSNSDILLASGVTVATIVHELGHAIDRASGDIPRRIIATPNLLYSASQSRFLYGNDSNIPGDSLGLPLGGDRPDGMLTRANPDNTAGEVWADVFMTWVLDGVQTPTAGDNPSSPSWDCDGNNNSGMANMWNTFAGLLMAQLALRGALSSSDDEFLQLVAHVTSLSPSKPCN